MKAFDSEAHLASVVAAAIRDSSQIQTLLCATEAEAARIELRLRAIGGSAFVEKEILFLPGFTQTGVYRFESARKIMAKRLSVLWDIAQEMPAILICTVCSFHRVIPSTDWLQNVTVVLNAGEDCDLEKFIDKLELLNYTKVGRVEELGEYAIRGSILDIWSPGSKTPTRLEFFGDALDKIRSFRVSDQRSFEILNSIPILPVREFVWPEENKLPVALEKFNALALKLRLAAGTRGDLLENIKHSVPFPGLDDLASSFLDAGYKSFHEIFKELCQEQGHTVNFVQISTQEQIAKSENELHNLYQAAYDSSFGKSYATPLFENVFPAFKSTKLEESKLNISEFVPPLLLAQEMEALARQKFTTRSKALGLYLKQNQINSIVFSCRNESSFFELAGLLSRDFPEAADLQAGVELAQWSAKYLLNAHAVAPVNESTTDKNKYFSTFIGANIGVVQSQIEEFIFLPAANCLVVSESWLRGIHRDNSLADTTVDQDAAEQNRTRTAAEAFFAAQFTEFTEGDLVVHIQHGIARYRGLMTVEVAGISGDFLVLEYSGNDKVYVPVHKVNLVQKYIGAAKPEGATLDALKSGHWEKRRAKAKAEAEKLARDLMDHQAKRATTPGHGFSRIDDEYMSFEAAFPYDETPDQVKVLREIAQDMSKPQAMDRLLCGDVGFGKTEVAMRAAYRCVLDGKQVAWLVPTTVLAHQHFRSATERFQGFGVNIEVLDRSQSSQAAKLTERLEQGKIDIIIGTHRLLSKDIKFRDLGLLVVDEEQRFGVLQKEKIKTMSYGIDVLTMTATPIPRTLQMAMVGLRDLSLLTTPPKARQAVKTFVCPYDEDVIKEAIAFEMGRGGQIFFVHNRVEELPTVLEYLKKLNPNARIRVGHGKLSQIELEKTIIEFIEGKFDILLCTTIIESGIDMPNVNTIFIQNADHFGLSQLYQLRGRVGRRSTRGYAYFLTSSFASDKDDGMARLEILREHQDLGSGFVIASHDLEMRGAGNILGDDQSGRVSDVGLETYSQMLDEAIRNLGGIKVKAVEEAEIQFPLNAQIPEDYIENAKERLRIYRRFFGTRDENSLRALASECDDRFGPMPESVKILMELARMRRQLIIIGAGALLVGEDATEIRFSRETLQGNSENQSDMLVKRIFDVCNRQVKGARLTPDGRLLLALRKRQFLTPGSNALPELKRVLSLLAGESYAESEKKS